MKFKKLLALGLAVAIAASTLVGCGTTDQPNESKQTDEATNVSSETAEANTSFETVEENTGIVFPLEETVSFTGAFLTGSTDYEVEDNVTLQYLEDMCNIDFVDVLDTSGAEMAEKWNLLIAGDSYGDFFWKSNGLDTDQLGMDGVFIPVEDLIREYMPNLTQHLDERNAWKDVTAPDGHMYSLPQIGFTQAQGTTNGLRWINKKWLDNLGLEVPTNMDELYDVLTAFKEKDANGNGDPNDEIPWIGNGSGLTTFPAYIGGMQHYTTTLTAVKDGELIFYPSTDEFKEYLATISAWYEEGLIYKDTFTASSEQIRGIGTASDVVGMFFMNSPVGYVPVEHETDYVAMTAFDPDNYTRITGVTRGGLSITDKCENPEILCAALDYFYTEEGGLRYRMGSEGDSYVVHDDGSYSWIWQDEGKYESRTQFALPGAGENPMYISSFEFTNVNKESEPTQWLVNYYYLGEEKGICNTGVILPTLNFTVDEKERIATLKTDINGYFNNYFAEVVTGLQSLESTWDTFQTTMDDMGADEYLSIYQVAYERAIAE